MANQYIVAKKKNQPSSNGLIGISIKVFESIATYAIEDIKGVRIHPASNFKKSVNCEVKDCIKIDMKVDCQVGINVNTISSEIQKKVAEAILFNTDFEQVQINVNIVDFYTK